MTPLRVAAAGIAALLLCLVLDASGHFARAQLAQEAPATGAPPAAAPTGAPAQSQPLAAPVGDVETTIVGSQVVGVQEVFTPMGLFFRADIVVKCVLVLLVLASFWSWVVIVDKWIAFGSLKRRTRRFEQNFWSGHSLEDLYTYYSGHADQPLAAVFVSAFREWKRSHESGLLSGDLLARVKDRVEKAMNIAIQRETEKLERGLSYLATVGSTAPFVGLFGTVWGIMNSFQAIALSQDASLAVVAPGIAEALFATALGLLAAIPAVIAYNRFVNELSRYTARLESFADEFSAVLSRQHDESKR